MHLFEDTKSRRIVIHPNVQGLIPEAMMKGEKL
jgi:hypothetical protein